MRIGALDIGTNTARLLVAEVDGGALGAELAHEAIVTRLGQGVDASGALHPDAVSRTLDVLGHYGAVMDDLGVAKRRAIATSAVRDAGNAAEFLDQAAVALGTRPTTISGSQEARLSFSGATFGRNGRGRVLVVDLGGGSTEFVVGTREPIYACSVDIGSVRLAERFLSSSPAAPVDVALARDHVAQLFRSRLELPAVEEAIGVAGTYTTLCAMHLGLAEYDRALVHGTVVSHSVLVDLVDQLATMKLGEIAAIPSMDPGRAPVMLAGAVIADQALAISGLTEMTISENDMLQGVALSMT